MTKRPTLDEVAHACGVSRATVSNAYNRPDQLSAQLRVKVLREARKLGYPGPNPTARSLATSRTGAIAVLLGSGLSSAFSDPALSLTLDALATAVDPEDKALLLLPGAAEGNGPTAERVLSAQADVVVAYSLLDGAPSLRAVRQRGLPLVVIDQPVAKGASSVRVEDRAGAAKAAAHLVELGHRRFAILSTCCLNAGGGELSLTQARESKARHARERFAGYLDTLAAARIKSVAIWESAGPSIADARPGALALLDRTPRPTALLCMSDQMALAALSVAEQLGLDVPGDLSIVGYDDVPSAAWSRPALTTVRQDLAGKGRLAGQFALRMLEGASPMSATLPVELVVRGSTAPAPH
ncbi:LacI family DNA-binding transcriptional regulator [Labedaea rhizosphaerae]|nr:LacI family DNA-binding transcriptional regulator [Labedaea rhizosphaerae]